MPPAKNSLTRLLNTLDADFKLSCPKCKSRNVHVMAERGGWAETLDHTFSCYTCGLRKYGEEVIYNFVWEAWCEWNQAAKEREAEKARKAGEEAQKARLREAIDRHKAEQRLQAEKERKEAEDKAAAAHQAWIIEMARRNAEPQPPVPRVPVRVPVQVAVEPKPVLSPEEQRRVTQAAYRDANRERRRENDRLRRARLREEREANSTPISAPPPEEVQSAEDRRKQAKRERDARYRAAKKGVLPPPPAEIIVPEPVVLPVVGDGVALCAWEPCGSPAREGSKYCSRNCSNKNARSRSKSRKV